jgi:hypothetical protein
VALEIFANQPQTTVLSGGTDSPSPGTEETWIVASAASFPTASSGASTPTSFHVSDTAAGFSGEIIEVINVSGTTWTVLRGAENTTPVTHVAGFTIVQVVTAAVLAAFSQTAPIYPSGDTSGATDYAAISAALTDSSVAVLQPGNFYLAGNSLTMQQSQSLIGSGSALTTIHYTGFTQALVINVNGSFSSSNFVGMLQGFTLNGYSAGSSSVGIQLGNLQECHAYDVTIAGFGGIGWHFLNASGNWSEEHTIQARIIQCGTANTAGSAAVIFDTGSFDYSNYDFTIVSYPATNGILLQNAALLQGCNIRLRGNFYGNTGTNTAAVIGIDVGNSSGTSYMKACQFDVSVEADGSGLGHYTVWMGSTSATSQFQGQGVLSFNAVGSQNFQGYVNSSNLPFGFSGVLNDVTLGTMAAGDGLVVQGGSQWAAYGNATKALGSNIYCQFGDVQMLQLASGSNSFSFNGVSNWAKRVELFLVQPSSGSSGTLTWPGSVVWAQGQSAPYLQTANNAVDRVRLTYHPGTSTWYGEFLTGANNLPTFTTKSGAYIQGQQGISSSSTLTYGTLRLCPVAVTVPFTLSAAGVEFTAQGDPASVFRTAIYNDDGTGFPYKLVADCGSISTGTSNSGSVATGGTAGIYAFTLPTSVAVPPGLYWVGGALQGGSVTQPTFRTAQFGSQFAAGLSFLATNQSAFGYSMTGVTGAMPSQFTAFTSAGTVGTFPRILFKVK